MSSQKEVKLNRSESEYAVEVENLEVIFHTDDATVYAVNGIDLRLKKGSVLGLVGAAKSP